jgi:hypothetical protein
MKFRNVGNVPHGTNSRWRIREARFAIAAMTAAAALSIAPSAHALTWSRDTAPTTVSITGGPWTLEQSGAANGLKSSGYCASTDGTNGTEIPNPGTERMQPYYFPFVTGLGNNLQGYFDWRPKDTDEAVVSASSNDGGLSWNFQDKVLELTTECPTNPNTYGDGTKKNAFCIGTSGLDLPCENASNDYSTSQLPPNGGVADDGQGHAFVLTIKGHLPLHAGSRQWTHR